MNASPSSRPTVAQVLLGLFVLGQLVYLPLSNFCGLLLWTRPKLGEEHESVRTVADATSCWGRMTGQVQNWRLFAPDVPTQAVFVTVELRWDEQADLSPSRPHVVRLLSPFEPSDPSRYFRPPGAGDRLFHYENRLGWALVAWEQEAVAQRAAEWREYITDDVHRQGPAVRAYLRWRLEQFHREHPDLRLPDEVIFLGRIYPTPTPRQPRGSEVEAHEVLVARWQPQRDDGRNGVPVEAYDNVNGRFRRLLIKR